MPHNQLTQQTLGVRRKRRIVRSPGMAPFDVDAAMDREQNEFAKDARLFIRIAKVERPRTIDDVPFHVIVPAFIISELKSAFQIGFLLYVPFLVVDLVVASVLMSMGMMMLPPIMISLPLKLMLFVLVDGWNLIVGALVRGIV